jgi:hypothetical protein
MRQFNGVYTQGFTRRHARVFRAALSRQKATRDAALGNLDFTRKKFAEMVEGELTSFNRCVVRGVRQEKSWIPVVDVAVFAPYAALCNSLGCV